MKQPEKHPTARALVANPSASHSPMLRLIAWATLKAERGQTVRQSTLHAIRRPASQPQVA